MVRHDKDNMRRAFQVGAPVFEGLVDREEFLVVNFVVKLRGEHRPRVVRDRVKVVVAGCHLRQDCSDRVVRPVGLDDDRVSGVEVREDGSGGECILQRFEGRRALFQTKGVSFCVSQFIGVTMSE